ncbi:DUF4225 domain-containing protein [Lelliottia amnigena]|uniref:DUF4225 domain-containing protein n=1 Tax=Lelliottia amnigena TaxID=61646 RepID=A0ABU7U7C3_LELAM
MDAALLTGGRNKVWAEMMVNLAARELITTANNIAATHLHDSLTRIQFSQEIKEIVENQFSVARHARTDEECMKCVEKLKAEKAELQEQGRLLKTRAAKLYARVEFIKENNKIVGYIISAVNIVLAGAEISAGSTLIGTMNPIGILAGAVLVTDGVNSITKEVAHYAMDDKNSEGLIADASMAIAEFLGFSRANGLGVYKTVTLAANAYTIVGLLRRPGTYRLFRYMPTDYYRKISTMSRPKLTMQIIGYGVKAKVVFDLMSFNHPIRN